ncbi:E3 ubiquitin-protein ligase SspH2 [Salmonella enterica subsp. enterica serovar Heidelberg str. RI-11-013343]|nr:E3 ubiquitin-protein ligase SspH2 [Salmonella enterica subsp. enterica serovar Heidelberg str. RI-11-013343]
MFGQEDNADAFSLFLDRLSETENFIKDAGLRHRYRPGWHNWLKMRR